MVESIFQTFLFLAYSSIAFPAIIVANYAVSASYLGRETRLYRWRIEKRKKMLLEKLKELQEERDPIEGVKNEIKEGEKEKRGLEYRIFFLSWQGAVIVPSICFFSLLIIAVVGINSGIIAPNSEIRQILEQQLLVLSALFLALGMGFLILVIRTVDHTARRLPIPKFRVRFDSMMTRMKLQKKMQTPINFHISNKGEDIAEDMQFFIFFHPSFELRPGVGYKIAKQPPSSNYPNYVAAMFQIAYDHIDVTIGTRINITTPDETGTFEIPVTIYERKIGESKEVLLLEIVD